MEGISHIVFWRRLVTA